MAVRSLSISGLFGHLVISQVQQTGKLLGKGMNAKVTEVIHDNVLCACKQPQEFYLDDESCIADFAEECRKWAELRHPQIVKLFGVYFEDQSQRIPMLILEKMDTTLWEFLVDHRKEEFALTDKVYVLQQVACSLCYLHSQQPVLVHCDLSPNNVLLNETTFLAKLTDFGLSQAVDTSKSTHKSSVKGTQAFIAPEAQRVPPKYDDKRDVFSYGNVVITMITHEWPHPGPPTGFNDDDIFIGYTEFERRQEHLDKFTPRERECFMPVVEKCLHNRPEKRPTSHELEHEMKMLQQSLGSVRVLIQDFVPGPFLDKYKDCFLDVVVSSAIRTRLEMDKVVPAELSFEMSNTSNDQATANLFLHLHAHASSDSIHKLCEAMISAAGYPKMNNLGEDMKNDKGLPPYSINLTQVTATSPVAVGEPSTVAPTPSTIAPNSEIEPVVIQRKPTFEERNINSFVYKSNYYKGKRVNSAKAIDVATGKEAKGKNQKRKHEAIELARANLKEELLKEGIISS